MREAEPRGPPTWRCIPARPPGDVRSGADAKHWFRGHPGGWALLSRDGWQDGGLRPRPGLGNAAPGGP